MITIDDPEDPRLDPFRDLPNRRKSETHFIAETQLAIERLLDSSLACEAIVATSGRARALEAAANQRATPVYVVSPNVLETVVGFDMHRGCAALGRRPAPRPPSWSGLRRVMVLERVADPRNVGALVRTALTLGFDAVISACGSADPFSRQAIRSSMGAVFACPPLVTNDALAAVEKLKQAGFCVVAAAPDGEAFDRHPLNKPQLALVLGNEGEGVSRPLRAAATLTLALPMAPGADSLSVTAAGAILLFAARGV